MNEKRGQIWVETIIYTLIAFVMIGLVLYFASSKISETQDKTIIDQSIGVIEEIDSIISTIGVPGNKRLVDLSIKKGVLKIDGVKDKIIFEMESKYTYSEPGENITYGNVVLHTEKKGELNTITLTGNYTGLYDLQFGGNDEAKTISSSSTPYRLFITNKGGDPLVMDFELG